MILAYSSIYCLLLVAIISGLINMIIPFSEFSLHTLLIVGVALLFALFFLGDSFVLSVLRTYSPRKRGAIKSIVRNISCRLNSSNVTLLTTNRFGSGVYILKNIFGKTYIIVGANILDTFSHEKIEELIIYSVERTSGASSIFRTYAVLIFSLVYLPFVIINIAKLGRVSIIREILLLFYVPVEYLREKIFHFSFLGKKEKDSFDLVDQDLFYRDEVIVKSLNWKEKLINSFNILDHSKNTLGEKLIYN